jgi:hypothetical protein
MKPRTLSDVDRDLKVMRGVLLDTVKGTPERLVTIEKIDKLLDERLMFTEMIPQSE